MQNKLFNYLITNLKNGIQSKKSYVHAPITKLNVAFVEFLKQRTIIADYKVLKQNIRIFLIYVGYVNLKSKLSGIKLYNNIQGLSYSKIFSNLAEYHDVVFSTTEGICTIKEILFYKIGGIPLCKIEYL